MKILMESTTKIVELETEDGSIAARVWEGTTESGIPCHVFVTRIAVAKHHDTSPFDAELTEHRAPSAYVATLPPRLIL